MAEVVRLSPNRRPGALTQVRYCVLHTTQGTNSLGWLTNPDSMVSATWLVPQNGPDWYRLGDLNDAMWHAGAVAEPVTPLYDGTNPNLVAWGIEFEGFATEPLTPFQLEVARTLFGPRPELPLIPHASLATHRPFFRSDPGITNYAAIRHPGGYADKLQQWIEGNVAKKTGAAAAPADAGSPFGPMPSSPPTGQRGDWPAERGPEPRAAGR